VETGVAQVVAQTQGVDPPKHTKNYSSTVKVFPVAAIKAVMEATAARCEPHFMKGRLAVDHNLVSVFKNQVQNVAVSLRFHI
jgi:hypothetical protein